MAKLKFYAPFLTLFLLFSLFVPSSSTRAQGGPAEDRAGGPRQRIEVVLQTDNAPLPGGTANLSITATPLINAPDLEVQWILPDGVQLSGTPVEAFGPVTGRQSVQSSRTLTFPSPGIYKIAVSAVFHPADWAKFSATGVLFFTIDPSGSSVSDMDPEAHRPARSGLGESVTVTAIQPNVPQSPDDDPCFNVSGFIDRIDRPTTPSGYGANVRVPLVGVLVEIRESDTLFDDSYGKVRTDANGNFSKSFCDDDGWFDDELEIYFRLFAERGSPKVYVEDSSWIDEEYEYDSSTVDSEGGSISFNLNLDYVWSGLFNIVDAAFLARQLWVDNGDSYSEETEIHWEAAYGDDGSYFDPFWNEITIADDPSNPDQWDDSVIMHEWGHSADDYYSCDDNPGGDHFVNQLVDDPELAWGEGYPDYFQSAVRAANSYQFASYYFDIDGSDMNGISINLEPYDTSVGSNLISTLNELAIAAALWDLNDSANDGQDTVAHGHGMVQDVYTSDAFNDAAYGFFDDTCDFDTYMRGWVDAGKPADAATAASILQNTGYTLQASRQAAQTTDTTLVTNSFTPADVYRWWKQLTYVGDNSASMSGPKFDAIKALFAEAVNDLGDDPEGTEFTLELFNNTTPWNQVTFAGQFFPENLIGPINGLSTIPDADPNCDVYALRALSQAIDNKEDGDVWLFTDGDTYQSPSVDAIRQVLNDKQLRASVALMGICPIVNETLAPAGPVSTTELEGMSKEAQQEYMADRLLLGKARSSLGPMADEVPGGLVPYLLTAINSGGQFLYVDSSQVDAAADILRAQIANSAGAGRWSDYVSDIATYRYDRLASYEYNWIDATDGVNQGNPAYDSYLDISLTQPFTYYNAGPYDILHVFQDGYLTFGNQLYVSPDNTTIPSWFLPNNAVYPFWDDLMPNYIICENTAESVPNCGTDGWIYTKESGDWFVLEYFHYVSFTPDWINNTFEVLLNPTTGEIRYQYLEVPDGASGATIGVENNSGTDAVMVSYNDVGGASNGMGYKFTPAPPQPTKMYTVTVDATMESVGFLLAGYSGSFEPLVVTDPDGNPVDCDAPGSLCLNLDLVQYVQVNTNGRTGDWHAIVDAGPTGSGTFSFFSMAASPIAVESPFDHTLASIGQGLLVELTQPTDNGLLTGFFNLTNGDPFSGTLSFFDDGLHGDGKVGDGVFGSDPFTPPFPGSAYLTLEGLTGGVQFKRVDPLPYTFTPVKMTSLGDGANFGGVTQLQWEITNYDSVDHCYWYSYDAPEGWWVDYVFLPIVCVNAGQTYVLTTDVYMTAGYTNNLPSGTTGILTLSITEWEKGEISDSASARITRHREPALIDIHNPTYYLRPNGDESTLDIFVVDAENFHVADGTPVYLNASMGTISPTVTNTDGGFFRATFTSGASMGTAQITAWTDNGITATTDIEIGNPKPSRVTLEVSDDTLPADGVSTATLVATVRDRWGTVMPNQTVRIGVEGDEQLGSLGGMEVVTGTTDANGQFTATFTSGEVIGVAGVRAELVFDDGAGLEVIHEDRKEILLGSMIYLPVMQR